MAKFYVVAKGRNPGIYETWEECQKNVINYSGAVYKRFGTLEDAENYLKENIKEEPKSITPKYSTDNMFEELKERIAGGIFKFSKFYVVVKGKTPGIFYSWEDCQTSIKAYSGAVYKSFNVCDVEGAKRYYLKQTEDKEKSVQTDNPVLIKQNEEISPDDVPWDD